MHIIYNVFDLIKAKNNKAWIIQQEHNILIIISYLYLSFINPQIGPTMTLENPVNKRLYCKTAPLIEDKAPYTLNVFLEKILTKGVKIDIPIKRHNLLFIIADFIFH